MAHSIGHSHTFVRLFDVAIITPGQHTDNQYLSCKKLYWTVLACIITNCIQQSWTQNFKQFRITDFFLIWQWPWRCNYVIAHLLKSPSYIPRIRRIGGCYGFTSKPPVARRPPPAARNGVNAITQKSRDELFSNLVYTLVVIVSRPD